jgi:hypothetical protein
VTLARPTAGDGGPGQPVVGGGWLAGQACPRTSQSAALKAAVDRSEDDHVQTRTHPHPRGRAGGHEPGRHDRRRSDPHQRRPLQQAAPCSWQLELLATTDRAVASQQQPIDAVELFRRGERASQEQNPTGTAIRAGLAQERYYSTWGYGDTPAPVRPAEPRRQADWLVLVIGVQAAVLVLVAGLAVLAARRASRRVRAGQTA